MELAELFNSLGYEEDKGENIDFNTLRKAYITEMHIKFG